MGWSQSIHNCGSVYFQVTFFFSLPPLLLKLENEIYKDKFFTFFSSYFTVYNLKLQITWAQTRTETNYQTFRGQNSYCLVLKLVFGSKALNKLGSSALQRKFYVNETNCAVSFNHYKYSLGIILSPCSFQLTLVFSLLYKNAPLFEWRMS